jgi:hypothetical protein
MGKVCKPLVYSFQKNFIQDQECTSGAEQVYSTLGLLMISSAKKKKLTQLLITALRVLKIRKAQKISGLPNRRTHR